MCGLAYRSELELKGYRGQMMAQKIQVRLGGDRSGFEFPDKREHHWRTYERLGAVSARRQSAIHATAAVRHRRSIQESL